MKEQLAHQQAKAQLQNQIDVQKKELEDHKDQLSSHRSLLDQKEKEKGESYSMMSKLNKEMLTRNNQKHSELDQKLQDHKDQLELKHKELLETNISLEEQKKMISQKDKDALGHKA